MHTHHCPQHSEPPVRNSVRVDIHVVHQNDHPLISFTDPVLQGLKGDVWTRCAEVFHRTVQGFWG